ncbi:GNAT family N-acetyltransferase [Streptomyces sp. J2-1]|uniref:GNAT family N-acetyltransferase n=1 Tax=Streptomyces corallincola TaxID=2851888 RepID=UPI001C380587|nr:GNAT family N-acetyltransferase [Streptomyces corallincola]MBV2354118.1 GNAT family N-acetyltransferase [Streptomyces corallincola]
MEPNDLTLRPITGRDELTLFNRLSYVLDDELADDLAEGRRRPEWMWVALRGDRPVARVAWWCRTGDTAPHLLDILDMDDTLPDAERIGTGTLLLRTALAAVVPAGTRPPEYGRFVPPDWRGTEAARRVVTERMAVVERLGGSLFVERLRQEWRPGTPVPAPTGRLAFRNPYDDGELTALMTRVLDGTLDAHSVHDLKSASPEDVASAHFTGELARYASPRDWWRVAVLPGSDRPVGFVVPAHNGYNPIIAYIAVLPEHRGEGHVGDLLAEGTRVLAASGAPRVRATTDLGNTPMAAAFRRLGYVNFEREINMTWN